MYVHIYRWGQAARAVRRMDKMAAVATFERDPSKLPRPSSATLAMRPRSALGYIFVCCV